MLLLPACLDPGSTGAPLDLSDGEQAPLDRPRDGALLSAGASAPARIPGAPARNHGAREEPAPVLLDPFTDSPDWIWAGGDAYFGYAVAMAGDLNGDGYDDAVIGSHHVADETGRVWIYLGAEGGLPTTPAAFLAGEAPEDYFGYAVAGAGDVDGDGYDDLAVGAHGYDNDAGRVSVYLGSAAGVAEEPAWWVDGDSNDELGNAVASAGDVNGDGYDDLLVGAHDGSGGTGNAYVFHGSAAGLTTAATTMTGSSSSDDLGVAVAGAGDVDGDGYDDVLIGAEGVSSYAGRVYVHHGSASGVSATATVTLVPTVGSGRFGAAIASAGDVDDDGYDDVLVGSPYASSFAGRADLFLGSGAGLASTAATTFTSSGSRYLGIKVDGAGDVDGDGYDDVAIGETGAATVRVFHGSAAGVDSTAEVSITTTGVGYAIQGAGDFDADGHADLLLGAYSADHYFGAAYAYAGRPSGTPSTPTTTLTYPGYYADPPVAASPGDLDGDGFADVVIGASRYGDYAGSAHVYLGSAGGLGEAPASSIYGTTPGDYLGAKVGPAGDANGDGWDDLLVGCGSSAGCLSLHLGSAAGVDTSPVTTLESPSGGGYFGSAVLPAGDADDDGYGDLLVGAYTAGTGGEVYLYAGSAAGFAATPAVTWSVTTTLQDFGYALAIGDFDGDGHDDLAVGARRVSSYDGAVVLFQGGPAGFSATAWTSLLGESRRTGYFGDHLVAADFDGDGLDDLVVGAPNYSYGDGTAFVYYGTPSGLPAAADLSLAEWDTDGAFGDAMAGLGDLTGDGYDDLAVGVASGRAVYVYEGSASGLPASPTTTIDGPGYVSFGDAVSAAGDVNGDGFPDLLVTGSEQTWLYLTQGTDTDGDGVSDTVDCDPADPTVGLPSTTYTDADGDTFGDPATESTACDATGVLVGGDCDDTDAAVNPDGIESCNGLDDDCDDRADEGVAGTFYADADGDGHGGATAMDACTAPAGYVETSTDCDDTDATVHPGAAEACNDRDDDCDGSVDDGATVPFYADGDADGYGGTTTVDACTAPSGYVETSTDCDDADADVHPDAAEACNDRDDDCDGLLDDGATVAFYADGDADGYGGTTTVDACTAPSGYVETSTDCDDTDAGVHPDGAETCDERDEDCDGTADEGVTTTYYADGDGDGYGGTATVDACTAPSGYVATSTDCDDADAAVHPDAAETCDERDDDCDGDVDEGVTTTFYADGDDDGYGGTATIDACAPSAGYVATSTDCDDTDAAVHPDATEACNEVDDDCDGSIDEGVTTTFYADGDADGHGGAGTVDACAAAAGYVETSTDCDDTDAAVHPGAEDIPGNEVDEDCDGEDATADKTACGCSQGATPGAALLAFAIALAGARRARPPGLRSPRAPSRSAATAGR